MSKTSRTTIGEHDMSKSIIIVGAGMGGLFSNAFSGRKVIGTICEEDSKKFTAP